MTRPYTDCGGGVCTSFGSMCDACIDASIADDCPMGCGRTTDDDFGGPCSTCWESADVEPERPIHTIKTGVL